MSMKIVAFLAFLCNAFLFGTYYAFSKDALARVDPVVFAFFVMMAHVPVALCIIVLSWRDINREVVKSGVLLGSCLGLGLLILSVALKHNSATSTAFFPSLNGFLAALCAWIFLRQPVTKTTWLAGLVSLGGTILLILTAPMDGAIRGSLIAFIGGLFCTFYVFLVDHEQRGKQASLPLFGIQLLTMALWANLLALLFGDWQAVHPALPKDIWIVLYISLGTICLPTLITVLLQKYIAPVTISFIYILEPVLGAVFANIYLHEVLSFYGYVGGGLVVAGALIHTWGTVGQAGESGVAVHERLSLVWRRVQHTQQIRLILPMFCFGIGTFILYRIGGFPPLAWRVLYTLFLLPTSMPQHGGVALLFVAQSLCWLVAWAALVGLAMLVAWHTKLLFAQKKPVAKAWNMSSSCQMENTARLPRRKREEKPKIGDCYA